MKSYLRGIEKKIVGNSALKCTYYSFAMNC